MCILPLTRVLSKSNLNLKGVIKIKKYLPLFLVYLVVNSILIYLAALTFPQYFTLGNWRLSTIAAALVSGFVWTFITFFADTAVSKFGIKVKGTVQMIIFYWIANFAALWITARLAPYTGFGTSRFIWILGLALFVDFVQYGVWMLAKTKMKK